MPASTYGVNRAESVVAGTLGELEEATPLDRPRPDEADGRGRCHRQLGMLDELLVRQHFRPADEDAGTAAPDQRQVVVGGDGGDELVIMRRRSVLDRLGQKPSFEKPQSSTPMDLPRGPGVVRFELELCKLGEQRMDAEPSRVLQASDEEVRVLQRLERGRRVGASEDAVAERDCEVAEDRRTQQEPARRLIERPEDLVVQVVGDESMISAELAHRFVRILDAAKPEQREVEGSRPTLRSLA